MADFRKCLYALALVALLAGFTGSANAQAFLCNSSTSSSTLVRAEGYAELLGDIVLDCTGGTPTPPGQTVPPVGITVNLDVNVTSQTTKVINQVEFLESLLIIDEPNSPANPTTQILNCGRTEAPDTTQAGAGVCSIAGGGSNGAATTYNGTQGHPNVFQGRSFRLLTGQFNQVVFSGIPIDPPGTICAASIAVPGSPCHRIIRITNIRGDATAKSVVVANVTQQVNASIIVNPVTGLPVDSLSHPIATVQLGLIGPALNAAKLDFIQCTSLAAQTQNLIYTFQEGFNEAFKPQSLTQVLNNGVAKPSYNYFGSGTALAPLLLTPNTTQGVANNQNVAGAVYESESGYVNSFPATKGDNPLAPLTGTGGPANFPFSNSGGTDTGIILAGIATQGTRLAVNFSKIPAGSSVSVPNCANLVNVIGGGVTGVAVLITNTSSTGFGGQPASCTLSGGVVPSTTVAGTVGGIAAPGFAVYEVFFSNPSALEKLAIPMTVAGLPNLPSNLPAPNVISQIQGSFAPFYDPLDNVRRTAFAAGTENTVSIPNTLAIPRFLRIAPPTNFFAISQCSCNLLFPYVTNAGTAGGSFDTGIAIANTSLDPGNTAPSVFGFKGSAQSGPVQLWFYNRNATPPAEPNFLGQTNTQCTNVTTPGSCTGTLTNVPAGGVLTYTLFNGGAINGATPAGSVLLPATGFTGYIIAQARFQYCHGFAFISKQGAGFQADNLAMGYLAIVLDTPGLPRTSSTGENDGH